MTLAGRHVRLVPVAPAHVDAPAVAGNAPAPWRLAHYAAAHRRRENGRTSVVRP